MVRIYLPRCFSGKTKGRIIFEVGSATVGKCLDDLVRLVPGIEKELFVPGTGETAAGGRVLLPHIAIDINGEVLNEALSAKVAEGDTLTIRRTDR